MQDVKKEAQKRAVIYARYSSSGQREESIEGQLREGHAFADRKGYTVVGEYADRALSGTTDRRPEFQRMIRDAQREQFDVVICWKHDRFARNRYDAALYKAKLRAAGVSLEYAVETVPEGPEGIIFDAVMEGYAEYYSQNLSQNVKRGLYESALKRYTLGQTVFGLIQGPDHRFALHPDQAPVVRRMFEEYAAGKPATDIVRDLNAEGFRTLTGGLFTKNSVRQILTNPKYKGLYKYADIEDPSGIPAIVSPDLWEEVQVVRDRHHEAPALKKTEGGYLLSGKLFCGHCEESMTSGSGTGRSGQTYRYYCCNGRRRGNGCKKSNVDKEYIEDAVVRILVDIVHSDAVIQTFADRYMIWQQNNLEASPVPAMEARVSEIEKALANLSDAIASGLKSQTVLSRIEELEKEKADVERGIGKALLEEPMLERDQVVFFLERFRSGDVDDPSWRAYLVRTFLQAAYLFDDGRLLLHLNYSGDCSRVSVDLLEEATSKDPPLCSDLECSAPPHCANSNRIIIVFSDGILAALARI